MSVAVIVAAVGVAASVPLIPSEREVAFIRFKDRLYDTAKFELERRVADGDLSVSVIRPLAELYLQYADVDSAILLLERFVADHPDDLAARRMLGTYYQFGQRPYDYLRNLEQVAARAPDETVLRELVGIYSWVDDPGKQIGVLQQLNARGTATSDDLVALARLEAARGKYDEAIVALDRVESIAPDALDEDGLELKVALLVDSGRAEEAIELGRRPHVASNGDLAARLARTLHGKGRPELAARLLATAAPAGQESDSVLVERTRAEVDAGLASVALARLLERQRQGRLPAPLRPTLVELAVFRGDLETAWSTAEDAGWDTLPSSALTGVIALANARGRSAEAQGVLARIGDECMRSAPVLAAQLAFERGDRVAAARWIGAADEAGAAGPEAQATLADLERRMGRVDAAYQRLERHLSRRPETSWAIDLFAQIALDTSRASTAEPLLERLRAGATGSSADLAWARVATAAGNARAVLAWLESPRTRGVSAQGLRDIAYLALDRHQGRLALAAASRLPSTGAPHTDRLLLARALSEEGRLDAALDVLRPLAPSNRDVTVAYESVLAAAAVANADAREELTRRIRAELERPAISLERRAELARRLIAAHAADAALSAMQPLVRADAATWLSSYVEMAKHASRGRADAISFLERQLRGNDLSSPARESCVQALLDLDAAGAAEPFLRELAATRGTSWVLAYDAALTSSGKRTARIELWRRQGSRADVEETDRRTAAFKLLELRDKTGAEQVLLSLAEHEAADGATVLQLLHLWGPRPGPAAASWLERRARTSDGDQRARWLTHLISIGGARQALQVLSSIPTPREPAIVDVWVAALRAAEDRSGLAHAIEQVAATSRDPHQLTALGKAALAESLPGAAARAYEALVVVDPKSVDARRWLGLLALAGNDFVGAREHLEHYVANGGRDPEALLRYGEALEHDGRADAAKRIFALGLDASLRDSRSTMNARRTHAFLLAHAGRESDAQHDLETLVAEQPGDVHLRADVAAWLMKEGRHADAKRVLDLR